MGNKISIKDKFETFTTLSPDNILPSLQEILTQKLSDEDIKLGILPNVIRKFIEDNADAFSATITECINHVFGVAGSEKELSDNEILYLNNVLMFIIRFLPILHEQNYKELSTKLLWTKATFPQDKAGDLKTGPYVMDDCLAIKLMVSLFKLMFYPDYAIMQKKNAESQKIRLGGLIAEERLLWRFYNQYRNDNDNVRYFYNRSKVLECLLACFSSPILYPLNSKERLADPWIQFCISGQNPYLGSALVSILNLGISYEENSLIPYTQYLVGDGAGEKLALLCLQIFCLFTEKQIDEANLYNLVVESSELQQIIQHYIRVKENKLTVDISEIKNVQTISEILKNGCNLFLREFKLTEYYDFISLNVLRVLRNPYDVENTFLLESKKRTVLLEEVLLVFWRLLENNTTYSQRLFYQPEFLQIVVHLLYQIHESFPSAARSNIFYIAIVILSRLSCDRLFAVQMKKKYKNDIGFVRIPIFVGSHLDLLFIIFLNGMVDSYTGNYFSYQNNLLAILHNVAPFAKDICPITTSLLIQLVTVVASPKVLKTDKYNMLILRKTLNLIHKILCYQPETCANLLYELLAQKRELECLKQLPLKKIYAAKLVPKGTTQAGKEAGANQSSVQGNQEERKAPGGATPKDNQNVNQAEEEEEKKEPSAEKQKENVQKASENKSNPPSTQTQVQLFDDKWMEIFINHLNNDLIFIVTEYLQEQLRQTLRERLNNTEEEVKAFLNEQSIIGIVPQPGPIMLEVVNDPANINNNLFLFLWQQVFLKNQGLPYFDSQDVRLLNVN